MSKNERSVLFQKKLINMFFARPSFFRKDCYPTGMTPAQCRAARGLLDWNQDQLATAACVSVVTVRNFENVRSKPQRASLEVMRRALEAAGVEFIPENGSGAGVRLKKTKIN
jgi:hypothetical protein